MTANPTQIRQLTYSDLPAVISIERRSFPTPWSLAMFVLELSKPSGVCLAAVQEEPADGGRPTTSRSARRGERLIGYLVCSRYDRVWHLMNVAVDPPERRGGVATLLLEELLERAGHDAPYTLEVRASNGPAISLYERFGFRSAGTRPRYYRDTGEDAMIMWRTNETPSASGASGVGPAG